MTTTVAAATPERARGALLAAEISLTCLTAAAGFGLTRLFVDGAIVPQVLTASVIAHLLTAVCRRRGISSGATAGIALGVGAVVIPWLCLADTTTMGLPTRETLETARTQLREAWTLFGDVKAPAPTLPGFVLSATGGVWFLAVLADTAAFRARGVLEAMVPASTLFVFGSALGAPRDRVLCTALYLSSLLAFWLSARALGQLSSPTWMSHREDGGASSLLRAGVVVGAIGVLAAVVVGPNLPGADAAAVIPWRASDRGDGGSRVTISPLVNIRTRIVDQAATEVFKVRSPERSYWRLTALETFNGEIWSSSRKYRRASGTLESAFPEGQRPTDTIEQGFAIIALDSFWLPAAFRPVGIDGIPSRYDAESGSLLAESENAIGQRYTVESAIPRLDAALLDTAPAQVPADVAETYLALPADFPPNVRDLAGSAVAGAPTPYQAAKRLQDFFRDGSFEYDLDVPPGHDDDALERFLFDTRRGYCEQFAGAYAAMARAIGLPARVAVGFTAGELGPDGLYSVRGYHGHAWPEVYLADVGWVAFEPTPGRGIPGGEGYTGVPESQAAPGAPNTATTLPATTTSVPAAGGQSPTTLPDIGDLGGEGATFDEGSGSPWPRRLAIAVAVLLGAPTLWVTGLWSVRGLRRLRRRAAATGNARITLAWDEVGEALTRLGIAPRASETPAEFASRATRAGSADAAVLTELATMTTTARYAPPGVDVLDDDAVTSAVEQARVLERDIRSRLDRRARVRELLDPRGP